MRKVLMLAATLTIPAAGAFVALSGAPAFAGGGPNGKMVCTNVSGNASTTVTISGCTDSGSATATASKPISSVSLETGGTVTWTNNDTSTFASPTLTPTNAKHCPGYVKPPKGGPTPSGEPSAEKFSGGVTADNSGLKIPGKFKGEVCISSSGAITSPKALKIS